ncbi:MAG: hypothetical protein GY941_22285 [Planctomycetes bacterium]|nr:hypothetical protein [Planctomycetota bacterium]
MQKVKVWVQISGDYCAWHETSVNVVADITNDNYWEDYTKEFFDSWEFDGDYADYKVFDALLVDGTYYVEL